MDTKGVCRFCKRTFSGRGIERHLKSCVERKKEMDKEKGKNRIFLIRAKGSNYSISYWIYFEVNALCKLSRIDRFLRELWVECCGHMSAFNINADEYLFHTWEPDQYDMDVLIKDVIYPGLEFTYEYDFGSTTELDMKCVSERFGKIEGISILARNESPEFLCDWCEKPAKYVFTNFYGGYDEFLCDLCIQKPECKDGSILPIVNSPRMGVCGYTGGKDL